MANRPNNKKKDDKPQVTGHEWDGIEEYKNNPPRWWTITWIVCIIWAVGYWFIYPTWPTLSGNTKGSKGWTQYNQLKDSQKEIQDRRDVYAKRFAKSSFKQIQQDPELMEYALRGGESVFKNICSTCHGTGGGGAKGFPNLNDDDWLWGGKLEDIHRTLLYGIRSNHDKTRFSQMPSFGLDKILNKEQINQVMDYVLSLSGEAKYNKEGRKIFVEHCATCHGRDAKGDQKVGAPNLTDKIWLYGSDREDLFYTIYFARAGAMPAWKGRLSDQDIRKVALYVHSLSN